MNIYTKLFGEIAVDVNKVITFDNGIIGFDNCKQYMLIHDSDKNDNKIKWLQSIDEPELALPIMNPLEVCQDYNPVVEDELLKPLGELSDEPLVFVVLTVPNDITKITANFKAPVVINVSTLKGSQIIVENDDYHVKHPIYDAIKQQNGKDGE